MGKAIGFPEQNDVIGKPEDSTDNQVYGLPVCRLITHIPGETDADPAEKSHAHISCWELTPEEIEEVSRTGKVYAKILGVTTYPLSVHGLKPIYIGGDLADKVFTPDEVKRMKRGNPLTKAE
jgi:hypothetical protein